MPRHSHKFVCTVPGCDRPGYAKNLCHSHYAAMRNGRPLQRLHLNRRPAGSPPRVTCDAVPCPLLGTDCHQFRGLKSSKGYGHVFFDGRFISVHRLCWEREVGPIPPGLVIDHVCRNRACCNVDHLRVVTSKVNSTENVIGSAPQVMAARTHCPKGHAYDDVNTLRTKSNRRVCRECNRARCLANARRSRANSK